MTGFTFARTETAFSDAPLVSHRIYNCRGSGRRELSRAAIAGTTSPLRNGAVAASCREVGEHGESPDSSAEDPGDTYTAFRGPGRTAAE